mmetsp:Transcript_26014/g.26220  ORF Transcript_26014/g.26220 Transcript_26014/m.26220 type:complete len:754 (-) Transcript_26014:311-2572(-)
MWFRSMKFFFVVSSLYTILLGRIRVCGKNSISKESIPDGYELVETVNLDNEETEYETESFAIASASGSSLSFIIMGDWGAQTSMNKRRELSETGNEENVEFLSSKAYQKSNNKNSNEKSYWSVLVAKAMGDYADENPIDFLLALGDNFYNNGVQSTSDSLWTTVYSNVYYYDSLQVPWYALFGNHDYGTEKSLGNLQAQIDYSDGRWHAGYCYKQTFTVPNSQVTIDVVFVDSTLIAPEETYATSSEAGISEDTQASKTQEQLSCMEEYLQSSTASYLIVAGHYPMFSTGKNGPGDSTTMVEAMLPYLEKYEVDAYLCGHDHRLEHLQYTTSSGGTMDFIISGAAGKPDNQLTDGITSDASSLFSAATGGFAHASVTTSAMTINFLDYTGSVLYSMSRERQRSAGSHESDSKSKTSESSDVRRSYDRSERMTAGSITSVVLKELLEVGLLVAVVISIVAIIFVVSSTNRITQPLKRAVDEPPIKGTVNRNNVHSGLSHQRYKGMARGGAGAGNSLPMHVQTQNVEVPEQTLAGMGMPLSPPVHTEPARHQAAPRTDTAIALSAAARSKLAPRATSVNRGNPGALSGAAASGYAGVKPSMAVRNIHEAREMKRPSNDAIAEAIAETARRIESLGIAVPDAPHPPSLDVRKNYRNMSLVRPTIPSLSDAKSRTELSGKSGPGPFLSSRPVLNNNRNNSAIPLTDILQPRTVGTGGFGGASRLSTPNMLARNSSQQTSGMEPQKSRTPLQLPRGLL